jgi:hypothetical protein
LPLHAQVAREERLEPVAGKELVQLDGRIQLPVLVAGRLRRAATRVCRAHESGFPFAGTCKH